MISKDYKKYNLVYNKCFPELAMGEKLFSKHILREDTKVFEKCVEGQLVGFALVEQFALRLICVIPEYQNGGYGSELLGEVETYLRNEGYERCILGGVSSRLFIGAPKEAFPFFQKRGYQSIGECEEMLMKLSGYDFSQYTLHGHEIATYGWYKGDLQKLQAAVASVAEDWVQYFSDTQNVYVAMVGDEIASFCLVDRDVESYLSDAYGRVGMPGCVGTVLKYRNRGIALEMVARVTDFLKESGMDISFVFFTGVARWYEKIGYQTFLTEMFGEKKIR